MVTRRRIAIIPARGGSKRIPRKNLFDFFGKPLIAWTVEAALKTGLFQRVFVSTDDAEIAEQARKFGADVPFLRSEHHDDQSNVSTVAFHVLEQIEAQFNERFETTMLLQPTCPLRDDRDIVAALDTFEKNSRTSQISCARMAGVNPWWAFELDPNGRAKWLHPEMVGVRSQDQPRLFSVTGAICVARSDALVENKSFYVPDVRFEPISWMSAIDIDDMEDMEFARAAYLMKHHAYRNGKFALSKDS